MKKIAPIASVRLLSLATCAWVLTQVGNASAQDADAQDVDESIFAAESAALAGDSSMADGEETDAAEDEDEELDEVVVTGYRKSLSLALLKKQHAVGQLDAIVADDMADFPDLNLAEALQRVPGVAISRQNGEGNRITVRGLSGLYTRTSINGMEARASVADNGTRQFDFNLFASELFNSVIIRKSPSADQEEGSLSASVEMNTARAFNYKTGLTAVVNAVGGYNDLSDAVTPRLTGLMAYHDPDGIWGVAVSAAYQGVRLDTTSTDTVAWQQAPFGSVNNNPCQTDINLETNPDCLEVNDTFHPRIPRFGQNELRGDRLGLTAGFQLRPGVSTEVRLDGLYARYDWRNDRRRLFPLIRSNEGQSNLSNYLIDEQPDRFGRANNSLVAGSLDNAWIRSENERYDAEARFQQLTLAVDHDFTGDFYFRGLAGFTRSSSGRPHSTTINYDNRAYDGYRFDLTDDQAPVYAFEGADVTDPTNFVVPELRDRVSEREGGFANVQAKFHYDVEPALNFVVGLSFKRSTYESYDANRDGSVCGLGLYECDTDGDGVDDVLGPTGSPENTTQLSYRGAAGPGSATQWAVPDADAWINELDYYNAPLADRVGREQIRETNLGGFVQARGEIPVGDMRLLYDGGVRLVQTRQYSRGQRDQGEALVPVDVNRNYFDALPSANAALWLNDEVVLRTSVARVLARPQLNYLSPSVGIDSFGFSINYQNPNLDPTRATTADLALEWYFGDGALLSAAGFVQSIDSFSTQISEVSTFASTGLPLDALIDLSPAAESENGEGTCGQPQGCWNITRRVNGDGAFVAGLELNSQAPFRSVFGPLPLVFRDMGLLMNYTYVQSEADYAFFENVVSERLEGMSNHSVNGTLYYDDSKFSARASLAYRSNVLNGPPSNQGNLFGLGQSAPRVDLSSSYNVSDQVRLSLEALNVTDAAAGGVVDINARRRGTYNNFGRSVFLGARYSFNN